MTTPTLFGDGESPDANTPGANLPPAASEAPFGATTSLYRKYRPQSFGEEDLVGQEHAVKVLRNAIILGRVAHAYLFSGPRGTGKTTTARVLAKAVNCLHDDPLQRPCNACVNCLAINAGATPDIVEIDAASNRGIDDIRDLRERVRYAPAQMPSKFYIIDEAHQITGAAANAFLKTLEEPPGHARFILATTDPEELLPTIVSRCQRLEFRRIGADVMVGHLRRIAMLESIAIEDEALRAIARQATGSLRDALGLLEQLAISRGDEVTGDDALPISALDVQAALGLSRNDRVEGLAAALSRHAAGDALRIVSEAIEAGEDPRQLNRQLVRYLRLLLLERTGAPADADQVARELAATFSLEELARLALRFSEIDFSIKHSPYPQLPLEVALVEATVEPRVADQPLRTSPALAHPEPAPRGPSLRDRVRGASAVQEPPTAPPTSSSTIAPITPIRPETANGAERSRRPGAPASAEVERIVELWPQVRADVKALNRRIEALLSEVDPVSVSGNAITLAVPYPFHRDKLNTDEVREILSGVLSRHLGRDIWLNCVLRGEITAPGAPSVPASGPTAAAPAPPDRDSPREEDRDAVRLRAATNIFDAEIIEPAAISGGQQPSAAESSGSQRPTAEN